MRYAHFLRLLSEPQLITPAAHASILSIITARLDGAAMPIREPGAGACGEEVEVEQMTVEDGIAFIPVSGAMGVKLNAFERGSGAVDTADIIEGLQFAENDGNVRGVFLDMDTPGGMYQGTPELARQLERMSKPVMSFTSGQICSAGYYAAAAATAGIYATPSADVGSIGVYCAFVDYSRMYADAGVSVELFKSDKYKGMGLPGTSLSDDQRTFLQDRIGKMAVEFKGFVKKHRAQVKDDAMRGQSLLSSEALDAGLIDGIVENREEAVEILRLAVN
jgi:signal peptide peptidase SppA